MLRNLVFYGSLVPIFVALVFVFSFAVMYGVLEPNLHRLKKVDIDYPRFVDISLHAGVLMATAVMFLGWVYLH